MTVPSLGMLSPHYAKLWAELVPSAGHVPELTKIANGLIAHKATYEAVSQTVWGDPQYWWYVAITDQMEGGGGANTFLGNGQSLSRVTTEVPAGLGPFANFHDGAVVALHGMPAPASIEQAAYNWEGFNGWGYLSKPIEDPYLASFSNKYTQGKWVEDHVYSATAVSGQPGALTILKVLAPLDPSIQLGETMATSAPWPPPKIPTTAPASPPASPLVVTQGAHVMVDITQVESEIAVGLSIAQRILPFLSLFGIPAPVVALLTSAINGAVHLSASVAPSVATNMATQNATPGLPNVAALGTPG